MTEPLYRESHFRRGDSDCVLYFDKGPVVLASVPAGALAKIGASAWPPAWPEGEPTIAGMLGAPAERSGFITIGDAWRWVTAKDGYDLQTVLGRPFDRALVHVALISLIGGAEMTDDNVVHAEVAAMGGGWLLRLTNPNDPRVFVIVMSVDPGGQGTGNDPMPVRLWS